MLWPSPRTCGVFFVSFFPSLFLLSVLIGTKMARSVCFLPGTWFRQDGRSRRGEREGADQWPEREREREGRRHSSVSSLSWQPLPRGCSSPLRSPRVSSSVYSLVLRTTNVHPHALQPDISTVRTHVHVRVDLWTWGLGGLPEGLRLSCLSERSSQSAPRISVNGGEACAGLRVAV